MIDEVEEVDTIFCVAIEMENAELRAGYIEKACDGNVKLKEKIDRLLSAHFEAGGFLTDTDQLADVEWHLKTGSQVGSYKLREKIGEGGFGVVYVAEQKHPVKRKVALKVIKPGMDSKDIIARFEAERQALAMMDHPNVAKVLDAGSTDNDRPYFVMELVHGTSITKFCDEQKLTNRRRLELFIDVCSAVQHAHQKGIIHRDLKPTNVMVTTSGDRVIPKVIDFGVAKALHHELTEKSIYTAYGQLVGTPMYMSPEQAQMSSLDVDTRSDIYSLGVLLYELLTGATPFNKETFQQADFDEMRRIIREDEPRRPSDRVSTLHAELQSTVSEKRSIDQRSLSRSLRGELDWIVLKALEKDRARRYETANGLADDVKRYLNDEPVLACPPSTIYMFRKFARRNKASLAIASVAGAGMLLVLVVLIISNNMISQREQDKIAALDLAQENETRANRNLQRAENNLDQALEAVERLLTRIADEALLNTPKTEQLRKQLYEDALIISQSIIDNESSHPSAQRRAAAAYFSVGRINQQLGNLDAADAAFRESINLFEDWLSQFPDHELAPDSMARLAGTYQNRSTLLLDRGDVPAAITQLSKATQIRQELIGFSTTEVGPQVYLDMALADVNHASLLRRTGEVTKGLALYESGTDQLKQLIADHPNNADYRVWMAWVYGQTALAYRDLGQFPKAIEHLENSLSILDQWASSATDLGWAKLQLAETLRDLGRLLFNREPDKAALIMQRGIEQSEKLCEQFPDVPKYSSLLCDALTSLGTLHQELGEYDLARDSYEKTIHLRRSNVDAFPDMHDYRDKLAWGLRRLAAIHHLMGERDAAEQAIFECLKIREQLASDFARFPEYRVALATSYESSARALVRYRNFQSSEEVARKAFPVLDALIADFPDNSIYVKLLADMHGLLGVIFLESEDAAAAKVEFEHGLSVAKRLVGKYPIAEEFEDLMVRLRVNLATCHCILGEWEDAKEYFLESIEYSEALIAKHPHEPVYKINIAAMYNNLGNVYKEKGQFPSAEKEYRLALGIYKSLLKDFPNNGQIKSLVSEGEYALVCNFALSGNPERALDALDRVLVEGFDGLMEKLGTDSDLDAIRQHERFKQILASLKGREKLKDN